MADKLGRNQVCECGSGRKYKHCCLNKENAVAKRSRLGIPLALLAIGCALAAWLGIAKGIGAGLAAFAGAVILAGLVYAVRDPAPAKKSTGEASAINFGR